MENLMVKKSLTRYLWTMLRVKQETAVLDWFHQEDWDLNSLLVHSSSLFSLLVSVVQFLEFPYPLRLAGQFAWYCFAEAKGYQC